MLVDIPVSLGELVDKITILRIKLNEIKDDQKLTNIKKEEKLLTTKLENLNISNIDVFLEELQLVNKKLWMIEDEIREKESLKEFDGEFIKLAREVYITNDKRFAIKLKINKKYDSELVEEKSYKKYQ